MYEKRPFYASENVSHLWLVDPVERELEAFELRDGQWLLVAALKEDDQVSVRPFEAITFGLADLWPETSD
ncbi:MAG: Uma2 family endonuclease [Boseongicola sp. SB0677_bin_26]|nr:Uma2 family endonuclease [Boseongicola sp. SB0677_bin_26]